MKNSCDGSTRLLYVAPRYHTNQIPIMKGLQEYGCQVMFLAQYEGVGEVHDGVTFALLKNNWISKLIFKHIDKKYGPSQAEGKKMYFFFPAFIRTMKIIREFKPDLVIVRERYPASAIVYLICRLLGINKNILYVQQPIFDGESSSNKVKHFLKTFLFPKAVFSPIYYHGKNRAKISKSNVHFIPLVVEGKYADEIVKRNYFRDNKLHFLDIGKYRDYKNHFFLIDVFSKLKEKSMLSGVSVTIIGQVSNSNEEEYFKKLNQYVVEKGLQDIIELRRNIPFKDMEELYLEHDVLLLPSTYESAGMVILEAMEMGMCVVASIFCGLSSYLEEYQCGYTFDLNSTQSLEEILIYLMEKRNIIKQMGQKSRTVIMEHLLFEHYLEELDKVTRKEFDYSIIKGR